MNRLGRTYRGLAALLSAVLLLGGVLPGLQGLCAEMAASPPQAVAMHAEAGTEGHAPSSSHDCEGDCVGIACCASVSSFTETLDLRLPDRGAAADLAHLRVVEDISVPVPDRDNSGWVRAFDSDLVSSVRLHVWTATFLS